MAMDVRRKASIFPISGPFDTDALNSLTSILGRLSPARVLDETFITAKKWQLPQELGIFLRMAIQTADISPCAQTQNVGVEV